MNRSWSEWDAKIASVRKEKAGKSLNQESIGSHSRLETIASREIYSNWPAALSEILQAAGIENADGRSRVTTATVLTVSAMVSGQTVPVLCLQVFEPTSTVLDSQVFALDAVGVTSASPPEQTRLLAALLGEFMANWQRAEQKRREGGSAES